LPNENGIRDPDFIMALRTVIIPAAGKGTRLMPATKVTAKELLPVFDRVAIDFAIEEAVGSGATRIVVVISMSKTAIRTYLCPVGKVSDTDGLGPRAQGVQADGPEIIYVFQDRPLGLGHAVLCCRDVVLPGPFGVILPDDIIMGSNCLAEMAAHYHDGHMVAAMPVRPEDAGQYGICRVSGLPVDRCIPVSGLVEKPTPGKAPSSIAVVGRYILDPMIFDILAHTPPGKGGEVQLTDAITIAALAMPLTAFQFSGTRHDCGNHDGLLAASNARQASVRMKSRPRPALQVLSDATTGAIHDRDCMSDRAARYADATAFGR
jgi:UTP--glucose-1-phosphate uridylyltransferase